MLSENRPRSNYLLFMKFDDLILEKTILITGASSSGKSEFAEMLATKSNKSVSYLATAKIDLSDQEWQDKIRKHQQRRPPDWSTATVSSQLPECIAAATVKECLLVDSLGTWVANFLALEQHEWQQMCDRFITSLQSTQGQIILVGEETGWGIIPAYPLGRIFRDRLGNLSRQVANVVNATYLVAGGHVLNLSILGEPLSKYKI